jgi:hypothetical protein
VPHPFAFFLANGWDATKLNLSPDRQELFKRKPMHQRLLLLVLFSALACAVACPAQTQSVDGDWRGILTNPAGFIFTAQLTLNAGPACKTCAAVGDGSIQGKIVWTLRKVPPNISTIVGLTGTEFVRGEIKGEGLLVLNGYNKDDPHSIVLLDQYRLAISDNGNVIGGPTRNNGSWTGQLIAVRARQ